jgi:uncharacterized protein
VARFRSPGEHLVNKPVPGMKGPTLKHAIGALCAQCGICCDGTLFKDVQLRESDDPERLQALGLEVVRSRARVGSADGTQAGRPPRAKFPQPCAALSGCKCRVYRERPAHCREFECGLLIACVAGRVAVPKAQEIILRTRGKAGAVRGLLEQLGDLKGRGGLGHRFRRVCRRLERDGASGLDGTRFARLTRGMHALNLMLGDYFYPGYRYD